VISVLIISSFKEELLELLLDLVEGLRVCLVHLLLLLVGDLKDAILEGHDVLQNPGWERLEFVSGKNDTNALGQLVLDVLEIILQGCEIRDLDVVFHLVKDILEDISPLVSGLFDNTLLLLFRVVRIIIEILLGLSLGGSRRSLLGLSLLLWLFIGGRLIFT